MIDPVPRPELLLLVLELPADDIGELEDVELPRNVVVKVCVPTTGVEVKLAVEAGTDELDDDDVGVMEGAVVEDGGVDVGWVVLVGCWVVDGGVEVEVGVVDVDVGVVDALGGVEDEGVLLGVAKDGIIWRRCRRLE